LAWGGGLSPLNDAATPKRKWNFIKKLYLFIHNWAVQLASKRVLSGSDCLKINGGWGFAPDHTGGAYSAPQTLYLRLMGPTSKGVEGKEGNGKGRGKGRERRGERTERNELVGLLSTTKNNAVIFQTKEISKSSSKIVRFPKFVYT